MASDPTHRAPSPWDRSPGPRAWLTTAAAILRSPHRFFRTLGFRGSNGPARMFLLIAALAAGTLFGLDRLLLHGDEPVRAWALGMVVTKAVLVLAYIEMAGVWFFSRQRGWRVPLRHAERLVAYAGIAWPATAAALAVAIHVFEAVAPDPLPTPAWLPPETATRLSLLIGIGGSLLLVESLVYRAVRAARFANI